MYSKSFRALMIRKLADPDSPGPMSIAKEIGVSRSTLYRWMSETDTVDVADQPDPPSFSKSMQRMSIMKRPQDWTPEEKLAAVLEMVINRKYEERPSFSRALKCPIKG